MLCAPAGAIRLRPVSTWTTVTHEVQHAGVQRFASPVRAGAGLMSGVLPPAVIASALQVYRESGTYAAAARAVGVEESSVRKALRRHTAPERSRRPELPTVVSPWWTCSPSPSRWTTTR